MKKVEEMKIKTLKVIFDIDGEEVEGVPATQSEIEEAGLLDIDCGQQVCIGTYVWVMVENADRTGCIPFKTRVRCNEN